MGYAVNIDPPLGKYGLYRKEPFVFKGSVGIEGALVMRSERLAESIIFKGMPHFLTYSLYLYIVRTEGDILVRLYLPILSEHDIGLEEEYLPILTTLIILEDTLPFSAVESTIFLASPTDSRNSLYFSSNLSIFPPPALFCCNNPRAADRPTYTGINT